MRANNIIVILALVIAACKGPGESVPENTLPENPAEEGVNLNESDPKAIAWADASMKAMGGREKWNNLGVISWNFFDARDLIWDKPSGRVRIDFPRDSAIYLLNIHTLEGKVKRKGMDITQPDSLKKYLSRAKSIWINDSYWLVMPFKLKDSGVTLRYLDDDTIATGEEAHILELTFQDVGVTPDNKYEVYITKSDSLVKQWAFYGTMDQDSASAIWPWDNYREYNGLLLSADRSDNLGPRNVKVLDTVPEGAFTDFDWVLN